jgi:hypothetical protein
MVTKKARKGLGTVATSYSVSRTIAADQERVWALLADAGSWTEWNPTIISLEGTIAVGNKVKLVSTVNPKRAFKLAVTEMDEPRHMTWADGMPLGLFKGVRKYTLTPTDAGTVFTMEEVYSGLLEPLISKSIPDMSQSFEDFADGLKRAAEAA